MSLVSSFSSSEGHIDGIIQSEKIGLVMVRTPSICLNVKFNDLVFFIFLFFKKYRKELRLKLKYEEVDNGLKKSLPPSSLMLAMRNLI